MSAEVINLRQVRKAKARGEREKTAAENRAKFGRTKDDRAKVQAETESAAKRLDGHKRNPEDDGSPDASKS